MRIAMVSTPFLPVPPQDYGGSELVIHELTEGLIDRGHEVTLYATGDSHTRATLQSLYPRAHWPPETIVDLNHLSWAVERASSSGPDVIHVHSAVALAFTRLLPDIPFVYTLHNAREEPLSQFYPFFSEVQFVAISEDQKAREVPLPRMDVIHHGVDPRDFEWTDHADDYVAFIARLSPSKGPHTAIDAAARAGVEIRIAGEVQEVDRAFGDEEMLPRLGQPHVTHLGLIGMEAKRELLRDARALLMPIEWNEPFGLAVIEAMLSGCPPVAFPRGSMPELIEPGVTGFLVSSMEEMAELIRPGGPLDGFDRRRCRERAVERFSRDRMVRDYERLYTRLLGGTAAVPAATGLR